MPVFGRNITVIKKKIRYCPFLIWRIVNAYEISNGIDEIFLVWNESNNETFPAKKRGKHNSSLITNDNRSLSVSRDFSNNLK